MATRAWAAPTAALNPLLMTRRSCLCAPSVSPARRSAATGRRLRSRRPRLAKFECRRAKNAGYEDYKFPDPIPEFAEQETSKFREHMAWRLDQKKDDYFGEHVEEIVDICTQVLRFIVDYNPNRLKSIDISEASLNGFQQALFGWKESPRITETGHYASCAGYRHILGSFLENDYCGPGTLLVHPFLDMKGEIKERGLPGAPQAARAAIAWAEKNIDKDWKAWTGEY